MADRYMKSQEKLLNKLQADVERIEMSISSQKKGLQAVIARLVHLERAVAEIKERV